MNPIEVLRDALQRLYLLQERPGLIPTEPVAAQVALAQVETLIQAARDFMDSMGRHHSDIYGREIPKGFTAVSGPAAIDLEEALAPFTNNTP